MGCPARKWPDDARDAVREASGVDVPTMYRVFDAVTDVVNSRRKSVFPGFGTFEWKVRVGAIPTGEKVTGARLVFRLSKYRKERYNGRDKRFADR